MVVEVQSETVGFVVVVGGDVVGGFDVEGAVVEIEVDFDVDDVVGG